MHEWAFLQRTSGAVLPRRRCGPPLAVRLSLVLAAVAVAVWVARAPDAACGADWPALRERMVREQLRGRGITDQRVLRAMRDVPRHEFVPAAQRAQAYGDHPLPIGGGQTISQPYIVALMTQLLAVRPSDRVLEIGTGSGYQAAVLGRLATAVYSIEIDPTLAETARQRLAALGYDNVTVRTGDGFFGWPEQAPFDAIMVTAATPRVPEPLIAQLREGGRIVVPLERDGSQQLTVGVKRDGRLDLRTHGVVLFVPLVGAIEQPTAPAPTATPGRQR